MGVVHCVPADDKSLAQLLADADAGMYTQKQLRHLRQRTAPGRADGPHSGEAQVLDRALP